MVNVKFDWNLYLFMFVFKGCLYFVGVILELLDIGVFNLIGGQKSVLGLLVGSFVIIKIMLDFVVYYDIEFVIEIFKFEDVNKVIDRLCEGKVYYCIVFIC